MIILQAAQGGMDFTLLFLMMGIFLVVQFVIIGPKQKKREKEAQNYISNMTSGTKLVTTGGIHGKFLRAEDNCIIIEVDTGVKLKLDKSAVNFDATKALNPA